MSKFTGDGKEDFQVCLADYTEATGDCGWTDQLRARWFSWFLAGVAKYTWQRMLNDEDKATWESIVQSYKGHYGVHMDPRTAYLRCHELQYNDYTSVQGLLEAMKDYQRKAPVWTEPERQVLLCQASNQTERNSQLKKQLQFGTQLTPETRGQMEHMLLAQSDVFALCDEELGKTDLVSHSIDTGCKACEGLSSQTTVCFTGRTRRRDEQVDGYWVH